MTSKARTTAPRCPISGQASLEEAIRRSPKQQVVSRPGDDRLSDAKRAECGVNWVPSSVRRYISGARGTQVRSPSAATAGRANAPEHRCWFAGQAKRRPVAR
jgi:hypothetical protein